MLVYQRVCVFTYSKSMFAAPADLWLHLGGLHRGAQQRAWILSGFWAENVQKDRENPWNSTMNGGFNWKVIYKSLIFQHPPSILKIVYKQN